MSGTERKVRVPCEVWRGAQATDRAVGRYYIYIYIHLQTVHSIGKEKFECIMSTTQNSNHPRTGVVRNREQEEDDANVNHTHHNNKTTTTTSTESDIQLTGLLPRPDSDSHKKLRRTSNSTEDEGKKNINVVRHTCTMNI